VALYNARARRRASEWLGLRGAEEWGNMSSSSLLRCCALGLAAALAASSATAQVTAASREEAPAAAPVEVATAPATASEGRTLNGHVFQPSTLVGAPFATTSFVTQIVFLGGSTTGRVTIRDQEFSGSLEYAGIGGFAGYEYSFLEHFSVRAWLNDLLYSGLTGRAVVVIGTEVQAGAGAGATASMKVTDALRVGVLFDVSYAPSIALTIADALERVADSCATPDGCDVDSGSLIQIDNLLRVEPAVAASWAPFRSLGLTANVGYIYLDGEAASGGSSGVKLAGAVDFDLYPAVGFPLGLQGVVAWSAPVGTSALQHVTDAGVGFYYTGRPDVSVGVQVLGRRFSAQPGLVKTDWSAYLTTIGLRYYW
jgi:hypothetical protein